jgi:hypothetical protein
VYFLCGNANKIYLDALCDVMPLSFSGSSRICLWPVMSVEYVCPESSRPLLPLNLTLQFANLFVAQHVLGCPTLLQQHVPGNPTLLGAKTKWYASSFSTSCGWRFPSIPCNCHIYSCKWNDNTKRVQNICVNLADFPWRGFEVI